MPRKRLDQILTDRRLVPTRSQAESYIHLGAVRVNGSVITKSGTMVSEDASISLTADQRYVGRGGLKLASVAEKLQLNFTKKTVLDVGSSTGGFTDYALQSGANLVVAVDAGSKQMHASLRTDPRVELHEQTDIRTFFSSHQFDLIIMDVSFISTRAVLPILAKLASDMTLIVVMVKPQFEAGRGNVKHHGVVKNDHIRRAILHDFEAWASKLFVIKDKADSQVAGMKGNVERFYVLQKLPLGNY